MGFHRKDRQRLWPDGRVPIDLSNVTPELRALVERAARHVENHSALRFVPPNGTDVDRIVVVKGDGKWCRSFAGRKGGPQDLACTEGGSLGVVVHELLHGVGLLHEHQRPDRDSHVTYLGHQVSFGDPPTHDLEEIFDEEVTGGYDYCSIMHYPHDDDYLIVPEPWKDVAGQRVGMSLGDRATLAAIYGASDRRSEGRYRSGSHAQSTFGREGNFEAVIPLGRTLRHLWRDNDVSPPQWHWGQTISAPTQFDSSKVRVFGHTTLLQSTYGRPGHLECAVLRFGYDADTVGFTWRDERRWRKIAAISSAERNISSAGAMAFLQTGFGGVGDFLLIFPSGSRLKAIRRSNDKAGAPWEVAGESAMLADAPVDCCAIQSTYGCVGNIEVVCRLQSGALAFFYSRDSAWPDVRFRGPFPIFADGVAIAGASGTPAMVQARAVGRHGNFELVVPVGERLLHYWRDNDDPEASWHGPVVLRDFASRAASGAVSVPTRPVAVSLVEPAWSTGLALHAIVQVTNSLGQSTLYEFERRDGPWTHQRVRVGGSFVDGVTLAPV